MKFVTSEMVVQKSIEDLSKTKTKILIVSLLCFKRCFLILFLLHQLFDEIEGD